MDPKAWQVYEAVKAGIDADKWSKVQRHLEEELVEQMGLYGGLGGFLIFDQREAVDVPLESYFGTWLIKEIQEGIANNEKATARKLFRYLLEIHRGEWQGLDSLKVRTER